MVEIRLKAKVVIGFVLAGFVDKSPDGIDILVGNYMPHLNPVHIAKVTRAQRKMDRNNTEESGFGWAQAESIPSSEE